MNTKHYDTHLRKAYQLLAAQETAANADKINYYTKLRLLANQLYAIKKTIEARYGIRLSFLSQCDMAPRSAEELARVLALITKRLKTMRYLYLTYHNTTTAQLMATPNII